MEKFIENYIRAVEEHRINLLEQINQSRNDKLDEIAKCERSLRKKVREARDVSFFLDELLSDGTDVEVMSFFKPVMNKIGNCSDKSGDMSPESWVSSGSLKFLPEEVVQCEQNFCPLYGVVTSQAVSSGNCVLHTEGNFFFYIVLLFYSFLLFFSFISFFYCSVL